MINKNMSAEVLTTAIVIAYQNPVNIAPCSINSPNYKEGKIIYSDKVKAIGYLNGFRVQYQVYGYKFRNITNKYTKIEQFVNMIKGRPADYPGAHHINFYGKKNPKQCLQQIQLT